MRGGELGMMRIGESVGVGAGVAEEWEGVVEVR